MERPIGSQSEADVRDYLAEERTFLAWIRTGLALMGFGFVVARFGLFLELMQITRGGSEAQPHGLSPWFGIALIAVGVVMILLSIRRHLRVVGELNRGQFAAHRFSQMAVILALFLALVGAAMALYLILARSTAASLDATARVSRSAVPGRRLSPRSCDVGSSIFKRERSSPVGPGRPAPACQEVFHVDA